MRKQIWIFAFSLCALSLVAAEVEQSMLYIEFRMEPAPQWAQVVPRKLWVARDKYMRLDEPPDSAGGIHGSIIVTEPDCWMVNWMDKRGIHSTDPGPTFIVRPIIFAGLPVPQLNELEFGLEKEFFIRNKSTTIPEQVFDGVQCTGKQVVLDSAILQLFLKKSTGSPAMLFLINKQDTFAVHYGKYINGLPLDISIFRPPDSIQIQESR